MAQRAAIRNEGDEAERRFVDLVPDARKSHQAKRGDAIVIVDGVESYVEIKACHATAAETGTINQVRAIKYICCVIAAPNQGCWYVISPDHLVGLAATKDRGHHTEIAFESMAFSLKSLPAHLYTKCDDAGLGSGVQAAIRRGRGFDSVREAMESLMSEIHDLRDRYRASVDKLLGEQGASA